MLVYWLMFGLFAAAALLHRTPSWRMAQAPVGDALTAPRPPQAQSAAMPLIALVLVVLVGLRYRVGGDWLNYLRDFRVIERRDFIGAVVSSQGEIGYTLLNWIAAQAGAGIWLVNLVCAVPFAIGLTRLCRGQPNPWLALVVATPILIIVIGMGFTRQAAALGFLMIALSTISEKPSLRPFIFFVLAGGLFHRTVLIFIPIVLAMSSKNRFLSYVFAFMALVAGYYMLFTGMFTRYSVGYLQEEVDAAGAAVRIAMTAVAALVLLLSRKRFFQRDDEARIWKTFAVLGIVAGISLLFVDSSAILDRLAMYLIPLQLVVLTRFPYVLSKDENSVLFWRAFIVIYSAAVLFVWLFYATNAPAWIPYQNYLL